MGAITAFARAVTSVNAWIGRIVSYVVLILFVVAGALSALVVGLMGWGVPLPS